MLDCGKVALIETFVVFDLTSFSVLLRSGAPLL
jgi:hypothetical protein